MPDKYPHYKKKQYSPVEEKAVDGSPATFHEQAYAEAEKKIKEARRRGVQELSLYNMQLNKLPDSIGELSKLTKLNLESNQLTELPQSLERLTLLQDLNVSNNRLKALWELP